MVILNGLVAAQQVSVYLPITYNRRRIYGQEKTDFNSSR
jgi:hypothetical protein